MKFLTSILFHTVLLTSWATAELPQKAPLTRYSKLWSDSPFTAKPPPPDQAAASNPLDDYVLLGVSPIGQGGYRVTLMNKNNPTDRVRVDSGSTSTDFRILGVTRKQGSPLGTVVSMTSGSMKGTVTFDEKLLTLTAPPAAPQAQPPNPGLPHMPGQPNNGQPQPQNGQPPPTRQPRPRVVPPPLPAPATQAPPAAQPLRQERRPN